jgi:hypothetical protein
MPWTGKDPTKDPKSRSMVSREARGYLELLGKVLVIFSIATQALEIFVATPPDKFEGI